MSKKKQDIIIVICVVTIVLSLCAFLCIYYSNKKNDWTAAKTIKAYKKAGSKEVAFVLKKGDKVKLNKVVYNGNKVFIQASKDKLQGFLSCDVKFSAELYFEEAFFAG